MTMKATRKRSIQPVRLTVTVEANRINENGTFSSFDIVSVKGANKTLKAVAPPQGGGSIYLKVSDLDGIDVMPEDTKAEAVKTKLF